MSNTEPLYFLSFCIEAYKMRHHLSGVDVLQLFDKTGATQYLIDGYEVLHTQGEDWIVADIEEFIRLHI